jgi:hypothetical protein
MCLKLLLCCISQIATGVPYSESPRTIIQAGPILIKIRRNLTCFRPVQSFDLLGWGSSPYSALTHNQCGVHFYVFWDFCKIQKNVLVWIFLVNFMFPNLFSILVGPIVRLQVSRCHDRTRIEDPWRRTYAIPCFRIRRLRLELLRRKKEF